MKLPAKVLAAAGFAVMLLPAVADANAQNRVYRCQAADGSPLYQNAPGPNCRELDLAPLTTVPAAKVPVSRASTRTASTSARIQADIQHARDDDRKRLLREELDREQQRLADLRREFNNGQPERQGNERNYAKYLERVEQMRGELARAESGVASLQRELGTGRD
ncbi:MAG: DUF4124 domain-containing protein [Lautropia sp.]